MKKRDLKEATQRLDDTSNPSASEPIPETKSLDASVVCVRPSAGGPTVCGVIVVDKTPATTSPKDPSTKGDE